MKLPNYYLNKIICGDCLEIMRQLPDQCIDMVMTSPPYWGLRDYEIDDQVGMEKTPELYVQKLVRIFNEIKRILKNEGTFWLNIDDSYGGTIGTLNKDFNERYGFSGGKKKQEVKRPKIKVKNIPSKCLCLIPEQLILEMRKNGWIIRNKIIWHKKNSLPASVKDRLTHRYELIYLCTKRQKYYFNLDEIREPHKLVSIKRKERAISPFHKYADKPHYGGGGGLNKPRLNIKDQRKGLRIPGQLPQGIHRKRHSGYFGADGEYLVHPLGKNPGDVWEISTVGFPDAHFAIFPEKLCERPIKAGCPEGGIVLDPFCGTGTALLMAKEMKRNYLGIDIKKEFCEMAEKRLAQGVL